MSILNPVKTKNTVEVVRGKPIVMDYRVCGISCRVQNAQVAGKLFVKDIGYDHGWIFRRVNDIKLRRAEVGKKGSHDTSI